MAFQKSFGIHNPDAGAMKNGQIDVACLSWCTSLGNLTPKMIKIQGEDEVIYELNHINVISSERKYYSGISTIEYICKAMFEKKEILFKLFYYIEENKWKMLLI